MLADSLLPGWGARFESWSMRGFLRGDMLGEMRGAIKCPHPLALYPQVAGHIRARVLSRIVYSFIMNRHPCVALRVDC